MQSTDMNRFRVLLREFNAEVQRQEDSLRALYPWLAKPFRAGGRPAPGANDNAS
ncbi:MAG TPA: hypothetical protein VMQ11_10775 [Alphaproteobacteria bacterium]|nr:hypothetical protein [Alphaproteobacteria bacterium]